MPGNDFLQGAQIGLGIAQQWAARSARQQELRVQDAYRRMQERQLAAQAEERAAHTLILNQQAKHAVEEDSAMKQGQIDMATDMELLGTAPHEAFFKHMAPVIIRYHPDKASSVMTDTALMPWKIEAEKALAGQRNAAAGLSDVRAEEEKTKAWLGPGNDTEVKPTAAVQNAKLLGDAQTAYDSAIESGNEALVKSAKIHLDAAKTAMHANREEDRGAKITDQAFKATHQALLTKLRNLYAQQPFAGKAQKPALDAQIKDIEEQLGSLITDYSRKQAAPTTATPAKSSRIKVKAKNGDLFTIPADQLNEAKKQGFEEVP